MVANVETLENHALLSLPPKGQRCGPKCLSGSAGHNRVEASANDLLGSTSGIALTTFSAATGVIAALRK